MRMPKMPLAMLEMDEEARNFIEEFENKWFSDGYFRYKTDSIEAFSIIDNVLHVIGRAGPFGNKSFIVKRNVPTGDLEEILFESYSPGILCAVTFTLYDLMPWIKRRQKLTDEFEKLKDDLTMANKKIIDEKIKGINLYQGSMLDVSNDLKKSLQRVDTGKPEKYIKAESNYWLRAEAYKLGANLVVNCQPGSAMGTPVKITENEHK